MPTACPRSKIDLDVEHCGDARKSGERASQPVSARRDSPEPASRAETRPESNRRYSKPRTDFFPNVVMSGRAKRAATRADVRADFSKSRPCRPRSSQQDRPRRRTARRRAQPDRDACDLYRETRRAAYCSRGAELSPNQTASGQLGANQIGRASESARLSPTRWTRAGLASENSARIKSRRNRSTTSALDPRCGELGPNQSSLLDADG